MTNQQVYHSNARPVTARTQDARAKGAKEKKNQVCSLTGHKTASYMQVTDKILSRIKHEERSEAVA